VGQLLAVKSQDSFHVVDIAGDSTVTGLTPIASMSMRINGGYFIFRKEIFDYLKQDEDLVTDACMRAAKDGRLRAAQYDGFWAPMDTLKERSALEEQYRRGNSPWALWRERPVDLGRPVIPVQELDPVLR
jgi:glucose-1-phosphate cytidylyltransferase